jgi:hypothetical protein
MQHCHMHHTVHWLCCHIQCIVWLARAWHQTCVGLDTHTTGPHKTCTHPTTHMFQQCLA